MRNKESKPI